MAISAVATGATVVVFDSPGDTPLTGATTLTFKQTTGMAAIFAMLPTAQLLMIAFANALVDNVGRPVHSSKVKQSGGMNECVRWR